MRIVSGTLKGRSISTPDGKGTRPTSDRARESIFNVLAHADWAPDLEDARVMDLFAGSGALGFEAISRGASFCLFVETEARARGVIRSNIDAFSLFGNTRIHRRSATDLGPKPAGVGAPFDLAFMDPPYGFDLVDPTLSQLLRGDWLAKNALIIAETGREDTPPSAEDFETLDTRDYGTARIHFLRCAASKTG
ncbi:MAG: 16S rRNA (guanine(966)-N(2))-methyltransferase RsmD [Pseudomonadota bacterium]